MVALYSRNSTALQFQLWLDKSAFSVRDQRIPEAFIELEGSTGKVQQRVP